MAINALKLKSKSNQINRLPIFLGLGMVACLALTAFVSYKLGDAALEGVVQPQSNTLDKFVSQLGEQSSAGENDTSAAKFTPMNIEKVAKDTRAYIKKQKASSKDTTNAPDADAKKDGDQAKAENDAEKKP